MIATGYLLFGLLRELPVQIKDMGVVKDDEKILVKKLKESSKISDIVINNRRSICRRCGLYKKCTKKSWKSKFLENSN